MKILEFTYEYGHVEHFENEYGSRSQSDPIRAIGVENYVVEDDYDCIKEMLWAYVQRNRWNQDDPLFKRVSCKTLDIKITGAFKAPQYYLKDV